MQIKNIEHGLRKTMVAVFKKRGMSEIAATAKALQNLKGATAKFTEAQDQSAKKPAGDATDRLSARAGTAKAQAKAQAKASVIVNSSPKFGKPSIKTTSNKVTSAEQVALHKVKAAKNTTAFLVSKTSASVAIALGAIAKWAKTLP